jgi:hypothetical protein
LSFDRTARPALPPSRAEEDRDAENHDCVVRRHRHDPGVRAADGGGMKALFSLILALIPLVAVVGAYVAVP